MEKISEVAKAVWKSPKVRLAGKGLLIAIVAVVADFFGVGEPIIELVTNL